MGRVMQVNVNPEGGVPKLPVAEAYLSVFGVHGDLQRDSMFHGGPFRAVSLFSLELIDALRSEGHPIAPGPTGPGEARGSARGRPRSSARSCACRSGTPWS